MSLFNIDETRFWSENPYFYTSHLAALLYLRDKSDFLFFMNGDTCFSECPPPGWLKVFFEKHQKAKIAGTNICHRGWERGPYWTRRFRETDDFWITDHAPRLYEPTVTLNDCAFFLPVRPAAPYDFHLDAQDVAEYSRIWPARAIPCFEMSYAKYLGKNSLACGLLKPIDGMPLAKHKNVKGFFKRILRHRILRRYYANDKYGTRMNNGEIKSAASTDALQP